MACLFHSQYIPATGLLLKIWEIQSVGHSWSPVKVSGVGAAPGAEGCVGADGAQQVRAGAWGRCLQRQRADSLRPLPGSYGRVLTESSGRGGGFLPPNQLRDVAEQQQRPLCPAAAPSAAQQACGEGAPPAAGCTHWIHTEIAPKQPHMHDF